MDTPTHGLYCDCAICHAERDARFECMYRTGQILTYEEWDALRFRVKQDFYDWEVEAMFMPPEQEASF